ncbi:MAG: hypothetical protein HOE45_09580 [Gammaproteobacteria bacterium]|uniref:hypothetical protein n=1 Tax=Methyloprofundus sp. TaxID=2020875 RepID=UPI0018579D3D|nr:hypothetical protein [Methyloprofundus sp.]MBT4147102.1 hypothetical protein [Gammaproteobacteria bacterium]HIG65165.1 hypothetical protein [Methyloprofundus sp.]HIL79109.1 hypothetical protein [Methylococcales bacterium]
MNDKYIDEDKLRKYRQEKEDTMPEEQLSVSEEKPKQVTDSSALSDAGAQVDDELDKQAVKNAPHVNVPSTFDYVNPKLSDMQRKLDEHNKELHKLQNAQ